MVDWFANLSASRTLPEDVALQLEWEGFAVFPGIVSAQELKAITDVYSAVEASASEPDKRIGSTSTRVRDFVNRGKEFDGVYLAAPLLDACCRVIGRPFKLSSFHSRTVRPHAIAQDLHVDVQRDTADWPLLGFILMIDAFRQDNGATRFVPKSHRWTCDPADRNNSVLACGDAGSLLIYHGSTWHGHSSNTSDYSRRSLQGAFIPREGRSGVNFAERMQPETRERLSPLARYIVVA